MGVFWGGFTVFGLPPFIFFFLKNMQSNDELRELKRLCKADIQFALPRLRARLEALDGRLYDYISDAVRDDIDTANIYELLGIRKFLRMFVVYDYDVDAVRRRLRAIEGVWEQDGVRWTHVRGGVKFSTPTGERHVRLMPYQVYCIAGIFGPMWEVDMDTLVGERELHATEVVRDGRVWDCRRRVIEAHIFQTRKSGKTEFGAAIDFTDFIEGPANGQVLIAANSREQAKIAFSAVKRFALQLDNRGKYLRVTAEEINFVPGQVRSNSVKAMSAGGKAKDGLFGSIIHADEHGSASYVKGHSDMQDLVEVCWGSTGPRREPLLLHTTTAGNVTEGPYEIQLRGVEARLVDEMRWPMLDILAALDDVERREALRGEDDYWFALLLRLDPWEITDDLEKLNNENLFRKVNRSIGVTVQPDYYVRRLREAADKSDDTRREVLTKDFNIWQTGQTRPWLSADDIRRLQTSVRIDDIRPEEGWVCYGAMDFSKGDDLNTQVYLLHRMEDGRSRWFLDCDCWVAEKQLHTNHNAYIYKLWHEQGWLRISPGETIDEGLICKRWMEIADHCTIVRIGYDNYDAKRFVNIIGSWLISEFGVDPKGILCPVAQTWGAFNGAVQEVTYMVKSEPSALSVSPNPLIPWCFGNAVLTEDRMENVKPVKATEWGKVDIAQCVVMATIMQDEVEANM